MKYHDWKQKTKILIKLVGLEKSSDFESNVKTIKEIRLAQEEEMEFHKYLSDLFSHVVRALTKATVCMLKCFSLQNTNFDGHALENISGEQMKGGRRLTMGINTLRGISSTLTNLFSSKSKKQSAPLGKLH